MNLKNAYQQFLKQLTSIYDEGEAAVITEWVFESIAGAKRPNIIGGTSAELSSETGSKLDKALSELLQHRPVQYILGEVWFYKMKLKVNENVLIPRPETEELVELVVGNRQFAAGGQSVLDIGTGSGCIAIAIKKLLPSADVSAIDISEAALKVAKENAVTQSTEIEFMQLDFLDQTSWGRLGMFDMIVSNPPYIPFNEKEKLDKNVTDWEPHTALFVPDNGPLLFYEKIAAFGKRHLNTNGKIFVELHEQYAQQTATMFRLNYKTVEIRKDIYGKERMLLAC